MHHRQNDRTFNKALHLTGISSFFYYFIQPSRLRKGELYFFNPGAIGANTFIKKPSGVNEPP